MVVGYMGSEHWSVAVMGSFLDGAEPNRGTVTTEMRVRRTVTVIIVVDNTMAPVS